MKFEIHSDITYKLISLNWKNADVIDKFVNINDLPKLIWDEMNSLKQIAASTDKRQ